MAVRGAEMKRLAALRKRPRKLTCRNVIPFPDLSIPEDRSTKHHDLKTVTVTCGASDGNNPTICAKKGLPEGAKQFPVGNLHKQGLTLIPDTKDPAILQWYGGKKS